ncbi:MAG TPA: hypothetical protein VFJ82_00525 [Longimicrobium sp.]|nr:hypothetical protein [Longimicrobium sp.]
MLPASGLAAEDTVWAVVLDSLYVVERTRQLVVYDRTDSLASIGTIPGIESATVHDFWSRSRETRGVGPLPRTRVPVVFVDRATIASLPTGIDPNSSEMPFWRAFYERYPGSSGLISLSRVGFNAARTQAVLNVDRGCGGLCGNGVIVLLTRDAAGRWRVAATRGTWVS